MFYPAEFEIFLAKEYSEKARSSGLNFCFSLDLNFCVEH